MTPGLYPKMPMRQYLDEKAFSSGLAQKILAQSPLHAWVDSPWNPDRDRDDSGTADIGTYAHAMLLEGGTDALVICPFDDWRKNDAKAMRDDARAAGKLPILQAKVPEVQPMVEAAKAFIADSELIGLFDTGAPEQTIIFDTNGVRCKARPDWLTTDRKICLSYKTTAGSAHPDAWIRTQLPGYDIGIVFYEHAVKAACQVQACRVVTLVQEQARPWSCSLIGLAPPWQALAEQKLSLALATWGACLRLNNFPAYPKNICWAEPPAYLMNQVMEREMQEGGIEYDVSKIWEKP